MPYYTSLGEIPPKRHIQFRRPDGELYSEEVFGTEGFVGPTSTMYHIHPPTQVTGWKTLYSTKAEYVETDVMRMRHLKSMDMKPNGDPVTGRVVLFGNEDCEMSVCVPNKHMEYFYKNGSGDECLFPGDECEGITIDNMLFDGIIDDNCECITDTTIINELEKSKNLITIVDLLGKDGIVDSKYLILLYIY